MQQQMQVSSLEEFILDYENVKKRLANTIYENERNEMLNSKLIKSLTNGKRIINELRERNKILNDNRVVEETEIRERLKKIMDSDLKNLVSKNVIKQTERRFEKILNDVNIHDDIIEELL